MKKILILIFAITLCLIPTAPAFSADELIYETFDNWKNPNVAESWKTHSVGGWGGEYNQIYEAAQRMECGLGESTYYRSIYKDFRVTPGKSYAVRFTYESYSFSVGGPPTPTLVWPSTWYAWLQFYDAQDRLLHTEGNQVVSYEGGKREWHLPSRSIATTYWGGEIGVWGAATAPAGSSRVRLVFQAGPGDHVIVQNVILYEAHLTTDKSGANYYTYGVRDPGIAGRYQWYQWLSQIMAGVNYYTYEKIDGPFINRNTEFSRGVNQVFGAYTFGNLSGEYKIWPIGGSSQGISSGGTFNDYKSVYRDLRVTPGQKYKLSVDVISNSTSENGARAPSPVRIWVQYDDKDGRVLSTHGIDVTQAGIKDNEWTTVTVLGPRGEPHTVAPPGTDHARIILQVMGGTGGGTIFDNVSFTRYEGN